MQKAIVGFTQLLLNAAQAFGEELSKFETAPKQRGVGEFLFPETRLPEALARLRGATPEQQQEQADKTADIARKLNAAGSGIQQFGEGVSGMRDQFIKEWNEKFPAGTTTPQAMPTPSPESGPQAAVRTLNDYLRGTVSTMDEETNSLLAHV
jgi:hypothetical protein